PPCRRRSPRLLRRRRLRDSEALLQLAELALELELALGGDVGAHAGARAGGTGGGDRARRAPGSRRAALGLALSPPVDPVPVGLLDRLRDPVFVAVVVHRVPALLDQ